MKYYLRNVRFSYIGVLIFLVMLGLATTLALPLLLVSVFLTYKLLSPKLDAKYFDSVFFSIVISAFVYYAFLQSVILITSILPFIIPLHSAVLVSFFVLMVLYMFYKLSSKPIQSEERKSSKKLISATDIIAIIVVMIVGLLIVVVPILNAKELPGMNKIFILISDGVDDASHIGILNDRIQFDVGLFSNSGDIKYSRSNSIGFYPAGWHSANAATILAVMPDIKTGYDTVIAYAITKVFWYLVLIYTFVKSAFIFSKLLNNKLTVSASIMIASSTLFFTYAFLLHPFREGFYSFIPQLISTLMFVLALIQLRDSGLNKNSGLTLATAMATTATLSWLLLLPVYILSILGVLAFSYYKLSLKTLKAHVGLDMRFNILVYAIFITAIIVQLVASGSDSAAVSFVSGMLKSGGIALYDNLFYATVFIGTIYSFVLVDKGNRHTIQALLTYFVLILSFVTLVYFVQLYFSGENRYYYFKALSTFTIVAILTAVAGLAKFINLFSSRNELITSIIFTLFITLLLVNFVPSDKTNAQYIRGVRHVSSSVINSVATNLYNRSDQDNYYKKDYTVYYLSGDEVQNDIASMLVKSNKPYDDCFWALKLYMKRTPLALFDAKSIPQSCVNNGSSITYVTDIDQASYIRELLTQINAQNISVIPIQ